MNKIDLHTHSTCSDGTLTPTELVDYAITKELAAFALTDHDSVAGLDTAISYAASLRESTDKKVPEVIRGIEFSTEYTGQEIHVVGLDIDHKAPCFEDRIAAFIDSRTNRNYAMCERLREHGVDISYPALEEMFPDAVITRAHYARYMLEKGYVKSISEAFDRYVGDHAPCYVPREKVTPMQAIEMIRSVGGIPVLAHPILYHMSEERLENLTRELKDCGLIGIEAIYSTYNSREERQIRNLAAKLDLAISGGSDFHGSNKPGLDLATGYGKLHIPYEVLENLRAKNV